MTFADFLTELSAFFHVATDTLLALWQAGYTVAEAACFLEGIDFLGIF